MGHTAPVLQWWQYKRKLERNIAMNSIREVFGISDIKRYTMTFLDLVNRVAEWQTLIVWVPNSQFSPNETEDRNNDILS